MVDAHKITDNMNELLDENSVRRYIILLANIYSIHNKNIYSFINSSSNKSFQRFNFITEF